MNEAELWWNYRRTGRTEYRNDLIEMHMAWAERKVQRFARERGLDWQELWGAAAIGLIEAVERFDPSCGVPFRGYAAKRISGALLDAARAALRGPNGHRETTSDDSDCDSDGRPCPRTPEPISEAMANELASDILEAMAPGRLREIARRRIFLGQTTDEIALAVGLGKSRVNELIRKEVMPRARKALARHGLVNGRGQNL